MSERCATNLISIIYRKCTQPTGTDTHAGTSQAELAAQAGEDAAWTELQRCTAWWLGEQLNSAAGETAGHTEPENPEEEPEDTAGLSAAESLALKV